MHTKQNKTKQNKTKKQVRKQKKTNKTIHTHKQTKQKQKQKFSNMHTGLQAQDIFPTVLFVVVWDGRDGENLPSGYKPVFFEWDGMDGMDGMGWDGMEVRVRILR